MDFAKALAMMIFRSLVIGILGVLLLLQVQHLVEHAGHAHAHLHHTAHRHATHPQATHAQATHPQATHPQATLRARLHTGAGEAPTWRRARPARATPATASRLTPITADTVLVDIERSSLQRLAGHDLLAQARMVPTLHHGRVHGLRFYAVRPGSLFAALGVQNGDVMLSINGRGLSRPGCAPPEVIADLLGDPPGSPAFIEFQLQRAGQPVRVVVLVHQRAHAPAAAHAQARARAS